MVARTFWRRRGRYGGGRVPAARDPAAAEGVVAICRKKPAMICMNIPLMEVMEVPPAIRGWREKNLFHTLKTINMVLLRSRMWWFVSANAHCE